MPSILKVLEMTTGTLKWFDHLRGFGFIQSDEGGGDVIVHVSAPAGVRP